MKDMFEENDKHEMSITQVPVKFKPDKEVDASKVDFSNPDILKFAMDSFDKMCPVEGM